MSHREASHCYLSEQLREYYTKLFNEFIYQSYLSWVDFLGGGLWGKPFGFIHLWKPLFLTRLRRPLQFKQIAFDGTCLQISFHCPGIDNLATLLFLSG